MRGAAELTGDSPLPPLVSLRTFRFWQGAAFMIIGSTGSGKTTIMEESLLNLARYFKFDDEDEDDPKRKYSWKRAKTNGYPVSETHLFVFTGGASLQTKRNLEGKLKMFDKVLWLRNDQWDVLTDSFAEAMAMEEVPDEKARRRRRHVVIVDDFVTENEQERRRVTRLLTHHKRHQLCCIILLTHQFVSAKGAHTVADNCERVYFMCTQKNRVNLTVFAQRRSAPRYAIARAVEVMAQTKGSEKEEARKKKERIYDFSCYDQESALFIADFRSLETDQISEVVGTQCRASSSCLPRG